MKTRTLHKALSMLLTAAMVLNMGLTPVFAAEGVTPPGVSGVCTHHTEHTADCGYKQGTPCTHEHNEDCYTKELTCTLVEGDAPAIATDSDADIDSGNVPASEAHTHGEDCYTKTDNCKHEHDETCGYTEGSPCTFDAASCIQCNTGNQPAEKICTCPPVDSGEPVHGKDCPLYTAPAPSEAVQALIALVDALPGADTITEENRETVKPAFDTALTAYEALSGDDKAAFEATEQYKKLMALHTVLYSTSLMANDATWDMKDGALTLDNTCGADCAHTITGTSTGGTISVTGGTHNVTLDNVTIDVNGTENACAFEIKGGAAVNLTLEGANTLKSGKYKAGLQVPRGNTLTITAISTGSLTATGGERGAGIGGDRWGAGGTVNINGGTVNATGGDYGAGIGGGYDGAGGNITISGGTVTATGGFRGAGIGGGDRGASGDITIEGNAVVFATKGASATNHIGAGVSGADGTVNKNGGIIFEGISGILYGTSVTPTSSFTIPSTHLLTIKSGQTLTIGDDIVLTNDGIILNEGNIHGTITGNPPVVPNAATHDIGTGILILDSTCGGGACNGHTVTGNTTTYNMIVESGTHNVTLDNVTIDVSSACAFEITGGATVNLTLEGVNTLKSGATKAGLQVAEGNTLTIAEASRGSLTATGGDRGAGIGGGSNGAGGIITINGGTVTGIGGDGGAGIGGGQWGAGGTVTISGGTVIANGGYKAVGIGGGNLSNADGTITIDGNAVVFATKGENAANHIGTKGTVNKTNGIIFEGASGTVYGASVTPTDDFTIPAGHALTIASGQTVDVSGITATNNGAIKNDGTISGTITGNQPNVSGDTVTLDISGAYKYVEITATGYKVGTAITETAYAGDYIITGTATSANAAQNHVMVSGGTHNVTLNGVTIDVSATDNACAFEIKGGATMNLTLTGANTLKSGKSKAGLQVPDGNKLTITDASTGSLTTTGGVASAGIGGGTGIGGGNITVNGGTVNATGGSSGAGMGGGWKGAGGTITISGGEVTATGSYQGAGVGGGYMGAGGNITISGGQVTATGGDQGAGIGGGWDGAGGTITIDSNVLVYAQKGADAPNHIGAGDNGTGGTVTRTRGIIFEGDSCAVYGSVTLTKNLTITESQTLTVNAGATLTIPEGITLQNNGVFYNRGGTINGKVSGNPAIVPNAGDHLLTADDLTITGECGGGCKGHTVIGRTTTHRIVVNGGTHNIMLNDVSIDVSGTEGACAFEITGGAAVNLTLTGENTLHSGKYRAGLQVPDGNKLTITDASTGSLTTTGGAGGAGIGGAGGGSSSYQRDGGSITISGGTITATGGEDGGYGGAGIGGGYGGAGGTIAIDGNAVVFAQRGSSAPNHMGAGYGATGGTITRTRGVVFEGTYGKVYGTSVTPTANFTIPAGHTLTIASGQTVNVGGITATNNGTVISSGTIVGTFAGTQPVPPNAPGDTITLNISNAADYVSITPAGYKVGGGAETTYTGSYIITGAATSTNAEWNHVMVSGGGTHNITLKDANIQMSDNNKAAFVVDESSTVNLTLTGTNVLKSGVNRAGLQLTADSALTITSASTGSLSATGGETGGAGIGGGEGGASGTITISGGTVTATSGYGGAGIGGGFQGAGGTIAIDGNAVVFAQAGADAPNHMGAGYGATGGTITRTRGVVFEGTYGKVYGNSVTLGADTTVPAGKTLTLEEGHSLLVPAELTLTNNGTITGTGFVGLLRSSAKVDGTGTGSNTHVKRLLQEDNTTISNTTYGTPPAVTWDGVTLTANTDFTVGNITTGASVPVTVTGVGDYRGSVTKNIAVDANSGGGGSSGDDSSTGGGNITPPAKPSTAETDAKTNSDEGGIVTAKADDKDILKAIEKAQKADKGNGIAITLNVKTKEDTKSLAVTLSAGAMTALTNAKVTQLTINNGLTIMTFDLAALNALKGGEVVLTITKMDVKTLSAEAQNAIAGRPVFRFGVTVGGKAVSDFKGGRVGLQMPYTRTTTEQAGNLVGVYVDGSGKVTWLENSSYDSLTGTLLTSTTHFSVFGVGCKAVTAKFADVGTHWAKNDIDFVVARGLLTGTSNTTFAPETSMTRGMFVTSLGRLAGVDTKKYSNNKFTDVAATAYYSPYVAWASANNIVTGTSDTTFSPDKAITRQEMAIMLVNYSKAIGYKLPSVHAEVTFTDASSIASWAKDAVKQTQMAGILMGKSGNRLDPTATATRAEVSAMLRRYVELVVNTETAEGWAMNESGQWLYIENGKRVTGKKSIDGKSYTFDQYGVTTALPPERKYLAYTVQAGDSFWSIARKYKVSMFELAKVNGKTIFSVIYADDELKIPQQ